MPRYVLTGAPGTGKTSLLSLLADQFTIVAEPAREIIAEHAAATGEPTLDGRPELFVQLLVQRSLRDYHAQSGVVIFDRGLPDCAAYAWASGLDAAPILEQAASHRYEPLVFIASPWREI